MKIKLIKALLWLTMIVCPVVFMLSLFFLFLLAQTVGVPSYHNRYYPPGTTHAHIAHTIMLWRIATVLVWTTPVLFGITLKVLFPPERRWL